MFCQYCGNQVDDNTLFCPYCGKNAGEQPSEVDQTQLGAPQMGVPQMQGNNPVYGSVPAKKKMSTGMIVGIICGIAAVIGLAVLLIILLVGGDDKKDKKADNKTTEEITEETTEATEASTATTEAVTEATTEATTEAAGNNDEAKKKANEGYSKLLSSDEAGINRYTWQRGYNSNRSLPVAIYDLNSDGIDELVYMEAPNDYSANLHIYSYADDNVKEIFYRESLDAEVAGGTVYYLAKLEGTDDLLLYHSISDEGYDEDFELLSKNASGEYVSSVDYSISAYPNEDYSGMNTSYKKNGTTVQQSEVDNFINEKQGMIEAFLLYSEGEDIDNLVSSKKSVSMTLQNAKSKLGGSGDSDSSSSGGNLPITGEMEFSFSSGAGGWGTSLFLSADGTFHGLYTDSNMGETGDGYPNGTIYYSEYEGKFKNITKIDDYTYRMDLDYYNTTQTPGTSEIYDQILYEYTEPYGVEGGNVFFLYLPGKPVSELGETFVSWSFDLRDGSKKTMDQYGLENSATGEGFFTYNY